MKKISLILVAITTLFACNTDDDSTTVVINPTQVSNTVTSGTWRISSFIDSGNDETNHFTGYNFTFSAQNVLTASNGTVTNTGTWAVTNSNSGDDNSSSVDFDIFFASPEDFTDLNEDWDIIQRTDTKLTLRHTSGGDGSIDHLVFDKN